MDSTQEQASPRGRAAPEYAQHGWAVFPCYSIGDGGQCSCGDPDCGSPGKHPRTKRGHLEATTDEDVIRGWWDAWPDANIGMATGSASGIDVLDVDPRHNGDNTLAELETEHGRLPDTIEQLTGGGGRHIVFAHQAGLRCKAPLAPGLDVRGDGGYVVLTPSNHVSGRDYEWEPSKCPGEAEPADWPPWLLAMMPPHQWRDQRGCSGRNRPHTGR